MYNVYYACIYNIYLCISELDFFFYNALEVHTLQYYLGRFYESLKWNTHF